MQGQFTTTEEIYFMVEAMLRESELALRDDMASAYKAGKRAGLLQVLHALQDDFGIVPSPYDDPLQRRADQIAEADRAEEANQFHSATLCYAKDSPSGFGVHLTLNGRTTLCGLNVKYEPTVPSAVEPLSCEACVEADHAR